MDSTGQVPVPSPAQTSHKNPSGPVRESKSPSVPAHLFACSSASSLDDCDSATSEKPNSDFTDCSTQQTREAPIEMTSPSGGSSESASTEFKALPKLTSASVAAIPALNLGFTASPANRRSISRSSISSTSSRAPQLPEDLPDPSPRYLAAMQLRNMQLKAEHASEVENLSQEISNQAARANLAESALQEIQITVQELTLQLQNSRQNGSFERLEMELRQFRSNYEVERKRAEQQEALYKQEKQRADCLEEELSHYQSQAEQQKKRADDLQLLLDSKSNGKCLVPETSDAGMSSELSVDTDGQSENNSCADLCNESGVGKSEGELLVMVERLQTELRTFRGENDMRTSQYIRAISRLTIMDDQARELKKSNAEKARTIQELNAQLLVRSSEVIAAQQNVEKLQTKLIRERQIMMRLQAQQQHSDSDGTPSNRSSFRDTGHRSYPGQPPNTPTVSSPASRNASRLSTPRGAGAQFQPINRDGGAAHWKRRSAANRSSTAPVHSMAPLQPRSRRNSSTAGSNREDLSRAENLDAPGEIPGGQYVQEESLHLDNSCMGDHSTSSARSIPANASQTHLENFTTGYPDRQDAGANIPMHNPCSAHTAAAQIYNASAHKHHKVDLNHHCSSCRAPVQTPQKCPGCFAIVCNSCQTGAKVDRADPWVKRLCAFPYR
uniref:Uncharacterized protein n=1 Tax=Eutreptiella gymnastica TaxID=73025 RepID=A0A7S1JHB0_9EUGL|mmetsp:Transcript_97294/g.167711  ORF Transcript_97294/g.167711 Transcript_97294/m.167711 type:complete len:669 (+) Transcript_97294:45-2051(+)